MRSPRALAATLAAAAVGLASAATQPPHQYTLLHRILPAAAPVTDSLAWSTRGEVTIDYDIHGLPSTADFKPSHRAIDVPHLDTDGSYQLALVRGPAPSAGSAPAPIQVVSTPSCLLDALVPGSYAHDVLALTLSRNASTADVVSFSYDVAGVTRRGNLAEGDNRSEDICPKKPVQTKGGAAKSREVALKVALAVVEEVESPRLRPPPPPRADGATGAEVPPPEKNFFQKYWYYILPILVLLALPSDAPAETGAAAEGSGARRIR